MSFVDGHSDTLTRLFENGGEFYKHEGHLDVERLLKYEAPVQFFDLFLSPKYYKDPLPATLEIIDFYYNQLEKNSEYIKATYTYSQILENKKNNKISAILALEGLEAVGYHTHLLGTFYKLGVRLAGLTWNYSNTLATGISEMKIKTGLTPLGIEAINKMNELGIIIDVSHLSNASFWDVVKQSKKPIVASHSNAYAVTAHKRNLSDEQIKSVAEKGGTIGINYYGAFLTENSTPLLEDVFAHISHIIKIGGEDVIALGSDFDGMDCAPSELSDVMGQKILLDEVEKRFGSSVREKIAEKNMLRVIREVWK